MPSERALFFEGFKLLPFFHSLLLEAFFFIFNTFPSFFVLLFFFLPLDFFEEKISSIEAGIARASSWIESSVGNGKGGAAYFVRGKCPFARSRPGRCRGGASFCRERLLRAAELLVVWLELPMADESLKELEPSMALICAASSVSEWLLWIALLPLLLRCDGAFDDCDWTAVDFE